jgi:hypothetical protein
MKCSRLARVLLPTALAALLVVTLLFGGATPDAFAGDPCCDPCPTYTTKWIERTVTEPAVTQTIRQAVFETIQVPVYCDKCTPTYIEEKVPIYRTRKIPVFRTCRTPKFEDITLPVYATREIPLTREVCDPCTGERRQVSCGCRRERYQSGTRTVRRQCGFTETRVQAGVRCETYQAGHQIRRVRCGTAVERVQTGTRPVRQFKTWRCRVVQVCPERKRIIRECVRVRCGA